LPLWSWRSTKAANIYICNFDFAPSSIRQP
jgi:hypothetical protein